MRFAHTQTKPRAEAIVPMINVVFLLLIFFLMTATIAPPDPLDVVPPEAGADPANPTERVLHLGAEGAMAYGAERGEAALAAAIAGGAAGQDCAADNPGGWSARRRGAGAPVGAAGGG